MLNSVLKELKRSCNLLGVIFAYRDGRVISEDIDEQFDIKKFTAMCASVLESAISLGQTISDRKINKIITELENKTIFIFKCDDKTFLTLIIGNESKIGSNFNQIDDYIQKIIDEYESPLLKRKKVEQD